MKKNIGFLFILFGMCFFSCRFAYVEIKNQTCASSKSTYNEGEDIDITLGCQFKEKAYIKSVYIGVSVYKIDEASGGRELIKFDVKELNNKEINTENEFYKYYKENYDSKLYRYCIKSEENLQIINEKMTISISEKGLYEVSVIYEAVSSKNPQGDTNVASCRFTIE